MSGVPLDDPLLRPGGLCRTGTVNKKMAYYDEVCVERLQAIQYLRKPATFRFFS
jgi:hypothetical protein